MNCIQKQQLVSFPKVRIWKPWFRHFNNHKEFRNEGTVHLFSLMALFSYANFRSNERMISGAEIHGGAWPMDLQAWIITQDSASPPKDKLLSNWTITRNTGS